MGMRSKGVYMVGMATPLRHGTHSVYSPRPIPIIAPTRAAARTVSYHGDGWSRFGCCASGGEVRSWLEVGCGESSDFAETTKRRGRKLQSREQKPRRYQILGIATGSSHLHAIVIPSFSPLTTSTSCPIPPRTPCTANQPPLPPLVISPRSCASMASTWLQRE